MGFNKKHYNQIKKFVLENLRLGTNAEVYKDMINWCADKNQEDYEGAKACKDALIEFLAECENKNNIPTSRFHPPADIDLYRNLLHEMKKELVV